MNPTTTTTAGRARTRASSPGEALDRLWAMTPDERIAAMRAGELTYRQLCAWSARHPEQVPRIPTGDGDLFGGEFEWLALKEPAIAEASDATPPASAVTRGEQIRTRERRRRRTVGG